MKKARETFKAMLALCYEEQDQIELHKELLSLESIIKKNKEYELGMEQIISSIDIFGESFPSDTLFEVEELYNDYMEY